MLPSEIRPGVELYINDRLFIDHGEDDTCGGIAVVDRVEGQFIYFRGLPMGLNIHHVLSNQEALAKEFGDRIAHPCPDVPGHKCPNPRRITRDGIMEHLGDEK